MRAPDLPPLRDYSRSRAVLVGTWDYAFLHPVPAVQHSLRRMSGLLTGPLCGWPLDRISKFDNAQSQGDIPYRLITAFDGIADVALFYFAGHGQIAPDDQLCLGIGQSRPEPNLRAATSLRFSDVRQALVDSPAAIKVVILDCCFAGLATTGMLAGSPGDVLDLTAGTGAYTMAATSAYTTAWYEDTPGLAEPQTYFTKYLADLIERGIPGQPSRLRLDPLFRQLRDNLAADQRPVPYSRAVNDAREFVFSYNAAPPDTQHDPERELVQLSQRLAETDAEVAELRAEMAEREQELSRLRSQLTATPSAAVGERNELREAIDEATRQLHEVREAVAAAPVEPPRHVESASGSPRRGVLRGVIVRAAVVTVLLGGPAAALVFALSGGGGTTVTVSLAEMLKVPLPVRAVAFGEDGSVLAAGTEKFGTGGAAYLWNTTTWTRAMLTDSSAAGTEAMAFGPSDTLATVDTSGDVYLWNTVAMRRIWTFTASSVKSPSSVSPSGVAFALGSTAAIASADGRTYLWDTADNKVSGFLPDPPKAGVVAVAIARNGALATVDSSSDVYVWNTSVRITTSKLTSLASHGFNGSNLPSGLAFAPDSTTLAVDDDLSRSVYLWNTSSGTLTSLLVPDKGSVGQIAFSPDGKLLAVADNNGKTYVWDLATRTIVARISDPSSEGVLAVTFAPGGMTLATGDGNGYVYVWNIKTG